MRNTRIHARTRQAAIVATLLVCSGFAVWPQHAAHTHPPVIVQPEVAAKHVPPLNLAAFRMPLWVADAVPPPPTPAIAIPPPMNLQLLAIVRDGAVYKAAVYDPDADRILVVVAGERIGTRSVHKVDNATMTLRDESGDRVLALKSAGEGT